MLGQPENAIIQIDGGSHVSELRGGDEVRSRCCDVRLCGTRGCLAGCAVILREQSYSREFQLSIVVTKSGINEHITDFQRACHRFPEFSVRVTKTSSNRERMPHGDLLFRYNTKAGMSIKPMIARPALAGSGVAVNSTALMKSKSESEYGFLPP